MAYESSNPLKKIAQGGAGNNIWFYSDDDTITAIATSGYFNSAYKEVRENDVILCVGSNGGSQTVDILVVTSTTGATTVTVTNGS